MSPYQPIPRLSGLPALGNLLELRRDRLALFQRVARECGDIGVVRAGPLELVLVNTPELAQVVLVDRAEDFEKTPLINLLRPLLGNGLLTSANAFHMDHTPAEAWDQDGGAAPAACASASPRSWRT